MKLHVALPSPNAKKCVMTLEELGLKNVDLVHLDFKSGDHRKPEFLRLNPNGKVPVLELDDGTSLWESNAIMNRLATDSDNTLWPRSNQRYDIMRWQFWEACHWTPAVSPWIAKHIFKQDVDLNQARENFDRYATVLNGHLEAHDWLSGENLTLADLSVSAILAYRQPCQYPLENYKYITKWVEKLETRPSWKKANPS